MDPSNGTKEIYKSFLKQMPIWSYLDRYRAELTHTLYNFNNYFEGLKEREERIGILPNRLKLSNASRISTNNCSDNNIDIVLSYRKVNGTYEVFDEVKGLDKNSKDPFRSESIFMMEEKIRANEEVYAMQTVGKPWIKCKVISVFRRPTKQAKNCLSITFRLRNLDPSSSCIIDRDKFQVARIQDHKDQLKPSKRVIAGLVKSNLFPGIVGEQPDQTNRFRYLVHMDDGSARYFKPDQVYPIVGQSALPWRDATKIGNMNQENVAYLRHFFSSWPRRELLHAKVGEHIELIRNGMVVSATLIGVDCDTIRLHYRDDTEESIYRGSPRLMKRRDVIAKQLANVRNLDHFHNTLLVHIHLYHEASRRALDEDIYGLMEGFNKKVTISRGHNTARKSTAKRSFTPKRIKVSLDGRTVLEDRDNIEDLKEDNDSKSHKCTPVCLSIDGVKTETSVKDIIGEFRDVSDLKVPLLLGWKRKLHKVHSNTRSAKIKIVITYEAPCGKIFIQPFSIRRYLLKTGSILDVDYFSFDRDIELNRLVGEVEAFHHIANIAVERKTGKPLENKNISLINQFTEERLPQDFEYRNESFPHPMLKSRGFSFNQEFKSSCDCDDDCFQRASCSCHRLNEDFFGVTGYNKGTVESKCQYNHKRLTSQVATGIFECNSFCKCSSKCSNRVVQNGIRFRLQVKKTMDKGWGVITLDDIPSGAFICTYSAELLDDADLYGDSDMYYADLDYITENEKIKQVESEDENEDEGVDTDSDIEMSGRKKKRHDRQVISESDESQNDNSNGNGNNVSETSSDDDVIVDKYLPQDRHNSANAGSRYPKRRTQNPQRQHNQGEEREQPKFKKIHDLLKSRDFTLDARMQGNVGRFFNHSCDPNSYVQNIFIETHDLRFPVVAFFAMRTIKALGEITWNYRYKIGSIPGRKIYCKCGASNCAGRIL